MDSNTHNPQKPPTPKKKITLKDFQQSFLSQSLNHPLKYSILSSSEQIGFIDASDAPRNAPTCLLLHGSFTSSMGMSQYVQSLNSTYRCIAPCLRGHGCTSMKADVVSLEDLAQDVEELMTINLKIKKFYVVSQSNACALACYFASTRPWCVQGMVQVSPLPMFDAAGESEVQKVLSDEGTLQSIMGILAENNLDKFRQKYGRIWMSQISKKEQLTDNIILQELSQLAMVKTQFVMSLAESSQTGVLDLLKRQKCPTLMLVGLEDPSTGMSSIEEAMDFGDLLESVHEQQVRVKTYSGANYHVSLSLMPQRLFKIIAKQCSTQIQKWETDKAWQSSFNLMQLEEELNRQNLQMLREQKSSETKKYDILPQATPEPKKKKAPVVLDYDPNYPSIEDLRNKCMKKIPKFCFEYMDGGCNEDINLAKNTREIRETEIIPQYIKDYNGISLKTKLFGHTYDAPFGIAPIGLQGLIWPNAPKILAKAAHDHNIPFVLSTVSTADIEEITEINPNAWFQLYHPTDNDLRDKLLRRCWKANVPTLIILSDVPSFGFRPRDIRNGLAMPPRMTFNNIKEIVKHPEWALKTLWHGQPEFKNLKPYMPPGLSMAKLGKYMNETFTGRLNEEKIKPIRDMWKGNLVLKGCASEQDAEKAVKLGVDGIIVSNHGGRQLDCGESSIKPMTRIAEKFGDKVTVMVDSGLRTGPDIASCMARGAKFTFMGRSMMYGVGALGNRGANHTISMIKAQVQQVMEQICCAKTSDFPNHLKPKDME